MHLPIHQFLINQFAEENRQAELLRERRARQTGRAGWSDAPELAVIAVGLVLLAIAIAATAGVF
jgi:hypothetical protein